MDIKTARAVAHTAANMFKQFKDLAEAADFIIGQDQFKVERDIAIAAANKKLAEATEAHTLFMVSHEQAKKKAADELSALNSRYKAKMEEIEAAVAEAEAAKVATIAVARAKQAEAEHELEASIAFLTTRKAVLEKDVKALENALDKIRAKVAV